MLNQKLTITLITIGIALCFAPHADASLLIRPPLYLGLNSGLVGNWSFDQADIAGTVAYDRSGQGNNGTLTNGPKPTIGKLGQGLNFSGNGYVEVSNSSSFKNSNFTISAWLLPTPTAEESVVDFRGSQNPPGEAGYQLRLESSTSNFPMDVDCLINENNNEGKTIAVGALGTSDRGWVHVVCTFDNAADTVNIYKNGTVVKNATGVTANPISFPNTVPLRIGETSNDLSPPTPFKFQGLIDDVRIYNRALSAQEVKRLYNMGGTLHVGASQNQKLTSGLVGLWSFDQADTATNATYRTLYDRSGNGNNGTTGTATGSSPTIGRIGQGLSFDGVNDYVSTAFTFNNTTYTQSAWVKIPTLPPSGLVYSILGNDDGNFSGHNFDIDSANPGTLIIHNCHPSVCNDINSTGVVPTNQWTHVAVVVNSGTAAFYINGQSAGGGSGVEGLGVAWEIGGNGNPTPTDFFKGQIDEVRIYNRALSAQEIKRLYNMGGTLHVGASQNAKLTNGLVGLWSFDGADMAGTVAYDRSGQGNNGTLTNGPKPAIGKIGQGMSFDGVNDYVAVGNPASLNLTGSRTISTWIYIKSFNGGGDEDIVSKTDVTPERGWTLTVTNDNSVEQLLFYLSPTGTDDSGRYSNTTLKINQWYHVVGVYNSAALTIDIYINGIKDNGTPLGTVTSSTHDSTHNVNIGSRDPGSAVFNGLIDEARIYNRALSAQEVKRLYNMGHTGP